MSMVSFWLRSGMNTILMPARFDEHDVAADGRPRQPRDDADLRLALGGVRDEARWAEQLFELSLVEVHAGRAFRDLDCSTAADRRDLALEVTHTGLARVVVD